MLNKQEISKKDTSNLLIKEAATIIKNAYAPYSKYKVAAAILTVNGKIFTGTNVENASYGLTICAERNAVFAAVAAGFRSFKMMTIVVEKGLPAVPCGACLQVLSEFCNKNFTIASYSIATKKTSFYKLGKLLPDIFVFKK